ncbi:MAG: histidine kinase N-terminal 7TM domain-containing protein [bacterium]
MMTWEITYITWIYLVTAIISLQLVIAAYRIQPIRGRNPFLWMMLFAFAWSMILTFESAAPTIPTKVFWSELEYFCNMGIPLFFLRFILAYNLTHKSWIERNFWIFMIVPLIALILVFTNDFHHQIWTGFSWSPAGYNILIYNHGPLFYVAMAYSLLLIILALILLIVFINQRPKFYKRKAVFLIAGSLFPLLTALVYTAGLSPVAGLDISPMGLLFSGAIFFWGITRGQIFDIVPAGHQLMIEKMHDGVIVLDTGQFIMDINPVVLKAFGFHETIIGRKLDVVIPSFHDLTSRQVKEFETRYEIFVDPPVSRWFEVMNNPLKDNRGKFLGSLLILHDITHRKRTEMQLQKLAEELTELNAMKDRLYSIIGHDLRSPFNSILGFSELLTESYDELTDEERRQFAININSASKGAYSLLENLLEWSRIQLGRTPFAPEELNLNLFVNETFVQVRHAAVQKDISLVNRTSTGISVFADKNMLSAILRNLVSNGIKFTNNGGSVEVSSKVVAGRLEICVSDNGIGMTKPTLEKLFHIDTLLSTPGTQNEKGTGLGLILCKEFIDKHGGSIRVESQEGKGSQFCITLPVKK